jgi:hypothetical protein
MRYFNTIAVAAFTIACGVAVGCGGEPSDQEDPQDPGQPPTGTVMTSQAAGIGQPGAGYHKCLHDCKASGSSQFTCDKKCGTFSTPTPHVCTPDEARDAQINHNLCLAGIAAWEAACKASLIGNLFSTCSKIADESRKGCAAEC